MQNEKELTRPQQELENALQSLRPAPMNIERDRLMFRAGQTSGRRRNLIWPAIAAVLAMMLGASLVYHQPTPPLEPKVIQRVVYVPVEKPTPTITPAAGAAIELTSADTQRWRRQADYFKLRDKVLDEGMDALPEPLVSTGAAPNESWEELHQIRSLKLESIFNEDS
ncbi:hypothetical protein ACFL02_07340 [Planctomycetota bacterium]